MAAETTSNRYKYNLHLTRKEEWYKPESWPAIQKSEADAKKYPFKDDDVIVVCSYPRSGTHMTWLLVRYLLQGSTDPIKDAMEDSNLPISDPTYPKQTGRRSLNAHYLPADFGDDFIMKGKHKLIHVSRNPKDTLISFFNIMDLLRKSMVIIPDTWEEFLSFILTTDIKQFSWFNYERGWEEFVDKNPGAPVLNLKFEEIICDPTTAFKSMAKFLDVPLSDKFLADLLIASKFENMKDAPVSEKVKEIMGAQGETFTYYRKGKIGDWVNTFTVAQNELFDKAYKEEMEGSKVMTTYH